MAKLVEGLAIYILMSISTLISLGVLIIVVVSLLKYVL